MLGWNEFALGAIIGLFLGSYWSNSDTLISDGGRKLANQLKGLASIGPDPLLWGGDGDLDAGEHDRFQIPPRERDRDLLRGLGLALFRYLDRLPSSSKSKKPTTSPSKTTKPSKRKGGVCGCFCLSLML
jgi:hypothetical protein